jgi:CBS domain-containing protein
VRISTLLANKGSTVATIPGDATVAHAVEELSRHHVGALVVSGDGQTIDGIVSERDVVRTMGECGVTVVEDLVSSIMSATVTTCSPEDDTESLMRIMTERRIRHVPVTDGGRPVWDRQHRRRGEGAYRGAREEPDGAHRVHHRSLTTSVGQPTRCHQGLRPPGTGRRRF